MEILTPGYHVRSRFLLTKLLFLSIIFLSQFTVKSFAQTTPQSCSGLFTVEPSRVYDANADETIFTFKITQTGAQNAMSHWGITFDVCEGTEADFAANAVAQTSTSADGPWTTIDTDYGVDPSQTCNTGTVLKFNQNMTETVRYFRLVVDGDVTIEIGLSYIKFGNDCCVFDMNFGTCCPPLSVNDPADQEVCAGEMTAAVTFTGSASTTFEWTNNNTSIGLAASGTGNIAAFTTINGGNAPVVATITVTPTFEDCEGPSQTFTITVNPLPVVDAGSYGPVCEDAADITLVGSPVGGTWSGTGVTGNMFDPSAGTQTLTYSFTDGEGCSGSDQVTITVNDKPEVDAGAYGPVCNDAADITLVGSPAGGTWSGTGVTGNTFDPSVGTQTLTYSFTDGNGCSGSDEVTITVVDNIVVDAGTYPPVCDDAADITLAGTPAGGVWSGTGVTGNVFDPSVGTQTLTYTVSGECGGSDQVTITVNDCEEFQGCTPGYWKIHPSAFCAFSMNTYMFTNAFSAGKTVIFPDITNTRGLPPTLSLIGALNLNGGGYKALARTAAAAIENSCHSNVNYPYTMEQIIAAVTSAFNTGSAVLGGVTYTAEGLKDELDRANNLGCPLNRQNFQSSTIVSSSSVVGEEPTRVDRLKVQAYPNPYVDMVKFVIQSPVSGEVNLQITNTLGQKIANVYKGRINANSSMVVEYKIPTTAPQVVIYTLTIGKERIVGRLLKANRP